MSILVVHEHKKRMVTPCTVLPFLFFLGTGFMASYRGGVLKHGAFYFYYCLFNSQGSFVSPWIKQPFVAHFI